KFLYPIAVAVSVITTLLTPYLIKSADRMVNWFDRIAPSSMANYLDLYTTWASQVGSQREQTLAAKLAGRWAWQMALNVVLIAGVFIAAVYVATTRPAWLMGPGLDEEMLNGALWLA